MEMPVGITPFLTFTGCAKEAIDHYLSVFPNSKTHSIEYYKEGQRGYSKGKILNAFFQLMGQPFRAMDFNEPGCPENNWAISFYINCADEKTFDDIFNKLSLEGSVLTGPEAIFDIRKASWVTDKFGVTWQIIWK
jgi:predicted 3-demethylubiquinone-9 3-methyltransferase (glyoxalase superfamily)